MRAGALRSVVVGSDGSAGSIHAVEWALAALPPDVSIEIVHVREHPAAELGSPSAHGDPRVRVRGELGSPIEVLCRLAREADLLVVGRTGAGNGVGPMGETAIGVVRAARGAVAVVGGSSPRSARSVVVGAADLPVAENPSVRALAFAYRWPGVEAIDVVHGCAASTPDPDARDAERRSGGVLAAVVGAAGPVPAGVTVRQATSPDAADTALVAASRRADLVVVGSRTDAEGVIRGSTSLDVCAKAETPVVVVR
jgi:nucleotide-binding universal stress UspA family protein